MPTSAKQNYNVSWLPATIKCQQRRIKVPKL
jgi:hypothetical protein